MAWTRQPPLKAGLRGVAPIAISLVLVAGCTLNIGKSPPSPSATTTSMPLPTPTGVASVPSGGDRLAVLDDLGNLVTMAPDGSDAVVLAKAVQGETVIQQPTWSPDGSRLAWVQLDISGGQASAALVTTAADGALPTETPTSAAPFYLFWDPTASRIAYLDSPSPPDIELGVAEIGGGGAEPTSLGSGRPFYLSWDPSGKQMLVHVGGDRLQRLAIDGTRTTVDAHPGAFNAPFWTADGRRFVYASATAHGQLLLVRDRDKEQGRELVRFEGGIRFVVSPDGDFVAFQIIKGENSVGPLSVVDRETGKIVRVVSGVVPAFFWSPASDRLLYLLPEADQGRVWFRWGVWGGDSTFTTPRFVPSAMFGSAYLQFFEQYAQSMSLWAPDGSAFTYAGANESGDSGIWVQPARPGAEPALVAKGEFATWSPG